MVAPLPPSLRRRDPIESIYEDIEGSKTASVAERSAMLSDLCRWAAEQGEGRPEVFAHQDCRSPESEALWLKLVRESRNRERSERVSGRSPPR